MRRYDYKNHTLELKGSRGTVYTDDKLLFRGDGYIAIKMFIDKSNSDPNVVKIFKSQLDMREDCKYKLQDEIMKRKKEEKKMFDDFQPTPKDSKKETPTKKRKSVDKLFR
tara:strand:+ start:207 stop:536 length:330 start_codon:yes stop_codon:yes gene_type:complete